MKVRFTGLMIALVAVVSVANADFIVRVPYEHIDLSEAAAPLLQLSSESLNLGDAQVGAQSSGVVTLHNAGTGAGLVAVSSPTAPFSVSHDCPIHLGAAQSCSLSILFSPTTTGAFSSSILISGITVALQGTGAPAPAPQWEVNASAIDFGDVTINASDVRSITLSNTGNAAGEVVLGEVTAPLSKTTTCESALAPGQSCSISVTYAPTEVGTLSTSLSIAGQTVTFQGAAIAPKPLEMVGSFYYSVRHYSDGTWWGVGFNSYGQFGLGHTNSVTTLTKLDALTNAAEVLVSDSSILMRKNDGTWWGAGKGSLLGVGDSNNRPTFVAIPALTGAIRVIAGQTSTWAQFPGGVWKASGLNSFGELGLGDASSRLTFTVIPAAANIADIVPSSSYTFARRADGSWMAAGSNGSGQLGLGDRANRFNFTTVALIGSASKVIAMDSSTFAQVGNQWFVTGDAQQYKLANGGLSEILAFTRVPALDNVTAIRRGTSSTYVRLPSGAWAAVGDNSSGQLALGDVITRTSVTLVPDLSDATDVFAGRNFIFARKSGGSWWAAGGNEYGQLGLGDTSNRPILQKIQ